jgi:hypothetical protein
MDARLPQGGDARTRPDHGGDASGTINGKCGFRLAMSFWSSRHQFAPLSLRESHIEAVVQPASGLVGDLHCPVEQRLRGA